MIAFSKLPSTAIYWHVKEWRSNAMLHKLDAAGMNPNPEKTAKLAMAGPEDWVAECVYYPPGGGSSRADNKGGE
jgi:hypothetical protein